MARQKQGVVGYIYLTVPDLDTKTEPSFLAIPDQHLNSDNLILRWRFKVLLNVKRNMHQVNHDYNW